MILVEGARIVCDYAAKGGQIGRRWPNPGYKATCDFSVGDKMIIKLYGGVSRSFPYKSNIQYKVLPAVQTLTTKQELDMIRVVPNPYIVWNEVQS